ncbi:MAG: hypothetical protein HQ559_07445 [Lentisphaerae bacterium]|nr:hypothetical protein [Lentisphaerota bacterium]
MRRILTNATAWTKAYYDRLIAAVILVVLLLSLLYLAVRAGMARSMEKQFAEDMDRMVPDHPESVQLATARFAGTVTRLSRPALLATWTNAMFVPEARVWCRDCRRPIPYHAEICPFCREEQPIDGDLLPGFDGDRDGMYDAWEKKYGLNEFDAGDASEDKDNDGFTNLEEFMGNPRTSPVDPKDSPPYIVKLRLVGIKQDPFMLRFRGMMTLPDDSLKFQINLRGGGRTYFKKLGEEVEGFVLDRFDEKTEQRNGREVDASVLTLKRGDREIPLAKEKDVEYLEFEAELDFVLDPGTFSVKEKDTFPLRGKNYEVIDIDSRRTRVLIRGLHDGKESAIGRLPGSSRDVPAPSRQGKAETTGSRGGMFQQ